MDYVLTIIGLILGIALFLYLISALDSGKRALAQKKSAQKEELALSSEQPVRYRDEPSQGIPQAIQELPDDLKDQLAQRRCPLCSKILMRDEPLYATHIEVAKEKKILIYGCPYCHKGDRKD
jgi:hypothetical protein